MQRVYRMMDRQYQVPRKILELNPTHPILKHLQNQENNQALKELIVEQIYESALLIEGIHPDPAAMIPRIQTLMESALRGGKNASAGT